jgi:hypothetical protein
MENIEKAEKITPDNLGVQFLKAGVLTTLGKHA